VWRERAPSVSPRRRGDPALRLRFGRSSLELVHWTNSSASRPLLTPPVLRTDGGNSPSLPCLHLRSRGRWIADVISETEGDGAVWLTVVSAPSSFDGRTLCVLLSMRGIGLRCCAAWLSLKVSLVIRGRASGIVRVPITGRRRARIWNVEATLCTSIANTRSIASIQRSRGDGVPSPVCAYLCRVMGERITLVQGPVESGGRYPPFLLASGLKLRGKIFGRPTNWIPLHPSFLRSPRLSSRPQRSGEPGATRTPSCTHDGSRIALRASGMTSGGLGPWGPTHALCVWPE